MRTFLLLVAVAFPILAQDASSMPSVDEINELVAKAEQKIDGFEATMKSLRADIDKVDQKTVPNGLNVVNSARTITTKIKSNGPTAYSLVTLVVTLDDISLNAASAALELMVMHSDAGDLQKTANTFVAPLMASKNECSDISELIVHVALRLIKNEENLIRVLQDKK